MSAMLACWVLLAAVAVTAGRLFHVARRRQRARAYVADGGDWPPLPRPLPPPPKSDERGMPADACG